jgi:hypothetical protein
MKLSRRGQARVKVVDRAIFATLKPLKLQAPRNLKSPFSNTRAIVSKLYSRPSLP